MCQAKSGFRVLAFATKSKSSEYKENFYELSEERESFKCDLTFLGYKKDTKKVISILKKSTENIMIATGDNPFTTISVARE